MIVFKSVSWRNFLSTGNSPNKIQLNKDQSTLIVGKNGEGKSTILDALTFSLFGKPFRNINRPQLINSTNQKNLLVEIEFSVGSNEYKVIRGMKPNVFEIYNNGKLINQDSATKDYQKILEQQILKLNYKTFTQVVILGSASFVPFMQLRADQRREVIEDILDISIFSSMNVLLKSRIEEAKSELRTLETKIDVMKTQTASQKKLISSMVSSKQDQLDKLRAQIQENEADLEAQTKMRLDIDNRVSDLIKSVEDETGVDEDIDKANRLRLKVSSKKDELGESLAFFNENDVCPSCSQGIPHEHKHSIAKALNQSMSVASKKLEDLDSAYNTLLERQKKISVINKEIASLNFQSNSIASSMRTIESMNAKLKLHLEEAKTDVGNIDEEKKKLQDIANEALSLIKKKTTLQEDRAIQEVASMLLKDSGIKTAIIKEYLPVMNKLINSYLSAMDFYVQFELDESFNEVIKSRHRDEFTYASFSEGEKQKIDLALLFSWRKIAKMKNSINTNLLIMDEIFDSSLDSNGTELLLNVMESVGDKTNVFVISHKTDALIDKFKTTIRFEKKNEFSVIT